MTQLVLVLLLIGWKSGTNLLSQSCSVVNAKPITFQHSNENRSIPYHNLMTDVIIVRKKKKSMMFLSNELMLLTCINRMVQRNACSSRHIHAVYGGSRLLFSFHLCLTIYGWVAKGFHPYDSASHSNKFAYSLLTCIQVRQKKIYLIITSSNGRLKSVFEFCLFWCV